MRQNNINRTFSFVFVILSLLALTTVSRPAWASDCEARLVQAQAAASARDIATLELRWPYKLLSGKSLPAGNYPIEFLPGSTGVKDLGGMVAKNKIFPTLKGMMLALDRDLGTVYCPFYQIMHYFRSPASLRARPLIDLMLERHKVEQEWDLWRFLPSGPDSLARQSQQIKRVAKRLRALRRAAQLTEPPLGLHHASWAEVFTYYKNKREEGIAGLESLVIKNVTIKEEGRVNELLNRTIEELKLDLERQAPELAHNLDMVNFAALTYPEMSKIQSLRAPLRARITQLSVALELSGLRGFSMTAAEFVKADYFSAGTQATISARAELEAKGLLNVRVDLATASGLYQITQSSPPEFGQMANASSTTDLEPRVSPTKAAANRAWDLIQVVEILKKQRVVPFNYGAQVIHADGFFNKPNSSSVLIHDALGVIDDI